MLLVTGCSMLLVTRITCPVARISCPMLLVPEITVVSHSVVDTLLVADGCTMLPVLENAIVCCPVAGTLLMAGCTMLSVPGIAVVSCPVTGTLVVADGCTILVVPGIAAPIARICNLMGQILTGAEWQLA